MEGNKIFDKKYRERFLRVADTSTLNTYLKQMEKLSKKGGRYLEIYNSDIDYIVNNDTVEFGSLINHIGGKDSSLTETERVCDTIGYIDKLQNITSNTLCNTLNQKTQSCSNSCISKLKEIEKIEEVLQNDKLNSPSNNDWKIAINKFIELSICCGKEITSDPHLLFHSLSYTMISDLIVKTDKYLNFAYDLLGKMLKLDPSTVDMELIRKFNNLRCLKVKDPAKYSEEKIKLINNELTSRNDRDRNKIFVSKIVEKIINAKRSR
jgi:hypothetical protein